MAVARIDAHSVWVRPKGGLDPYALLACDETGMDAIPLPETTTTTTYGKNCAGDFVPVVVAQDPPGDLPSSTINFYELIERVHPMLEYFASGTELNLQRLRFNTARNMDVRALAQQVDLLEILLTGGERGAAPNIDGTGGPLASNVTFDIEKLLTIQLNLSLARVAVPAAATADAVTATIQDRDIDLDTGYRGKDKVIYMGLDGATNNLFVSLDGGGSFLATTPTAVFTGATNVKALGWQPLGETSFRLMVGGGPAVASLALAYMDIDYGNEDGGVTALVPNEIAISGMSAATDGVTAMLWPTYNRLYIATVDATPTAANARIFISSGAGATDPSLDTTIAPGQVINDFYQDAAESVWAVGNANLLLEESSGSRGTFAARVGPVTGADLMSIAVADDGVLYVGTGAHASGGIYRASDGGRGSWVQVLSIPATSIVTDIQVIAGSSEIVYATIDDATPVGQVQRTIDGGRSWTPISPSTNAGYNQLLPTSNANQMYLFGGAQGGSALVELLA